MVPTAEQALRWALANPDFAISLAALFLGGGEALRQYRRTGRFPLSDLPWAAARRVYYGLRRRYATYPKPDTDELWTVNEDADDVANLLGRQSYELRWPFSWLYRGEDINARRYYHSPEREFPHRQIHIRAWEDGDRTQINAHEEPSAIHHTRAHIRSNDLTDCSRWVAMHYQNPNGLDPRSFEKHRDREARRADPSSTGSRIEADT